MNRTISSCLTSVVFLLICLTASNRSFSKNLNLPAADLSLIKTVNTPIPEVGDIVRFSVWIENEGPLDAENVVINAYIKNGYGNISNISHGGVLKNDTIQWNLPIILDNESITLSYDAKVNNPGPGVDYDNTAEVFAMDQYDRDSTPGNGVDPDGDGLIGPLDTNPNDGSIDPNGEDDSDNEPVHPVYIDLSLIKIVDNENPFLGDPVVFTIILRNDGPDPATDILVVDSLPPGLSNIQDLSKFGNIVNQAINFNISLLNPNDSIELSYRAETIDSDDFTNIAEVYSVNEFDADSTPGNGADTDGDGLIGPLDDDGSFDLDDEDDGDDARLNPKRIDLNLVKSVDNQFPTIGEIIEFTIKITNESDYNATGVGITDSLPNGYGNIQNISSSGEAIGSQIIWSDLNVAANTFISVSFEAEVLDPVDPNYINIAEITSADQFDMDSTPGNGADTDGDGLIGPIDDDGSLDPDDEDDGDDAVVYPCRLSVEITAIDSICKSECITLSATTANANGALVYNWNQNLSPDPAVLVCPETNTNYILIIEDENGCIAIDSFEVFIKCAEDPVLSLIGGEDFHNCDQEPVFGDLSINSDCNIIDTEITDELIGNACTINISRTWTVTNECGEQFSISALSTSIDTVSPILTNLPNDLTVECPSDVPGIQNVQVIDNCDEDITISFEQTQIPDCMNGTVYNSWSAVDCSGNSIEYTQAINILDELAPVLSEVPLDLTVDCEDVPLASVITAIDNCDPDIIVVFNENIVPTNCQYNYTIERSWLAQDCNQNETYIKQYITVQDTTPPTLTGIDADSTFSCELDPQWSSPSFEDNCSIPGISFYDRINSGPCADTLIRKWTATDDCGNTSTATQTLISIDTVSPVIILNEKLYFSCNETAIFSQAIATDNCGEVTLIFEDREGEQNCAGIERVRVWTASDNCGNLSTAQETLIPMDTIAPIISNVGSNGNFECGSTPIFSEPNADDDCGLASFEYHDQSVDGDCAGDGIMRIWTATDNCGNSSTSTQTLYPQDTNNPIINDLENNGFYDCEESPIFSNPSIEDCSFAEIDYVDMFVLGSCAGSGTARVWTATDICGNTSTAMQTLIPIDNEGPQIIGVGDNGTFACPGDPIFSKPQTIDNCTSVLLSFSDDTLAFNCGREVIQRIWVARDECGNNSFASQIMVSIDTIAPQFGPLDSFVNFQCGEILPIPDVLATDECSETRIEFTESIIPSVCAGESKLLQWTATDACGNSTVLIQIQNAIDTVPPGIIGIDIDGTYLCGEDPIFSDPEAFDECSEASLEFEDRITGSTCAGLIITRVWTAMDECGNISIASQSMSAVDTLSPVFTNIPQDGDYSCGTEAEFGTPDVMDCLSYVLHIETIEIDSNCAGITLMKTWTATDQCGNSSSVSQTLTPIDTIAPSFSLIDSIAYFDCDSIPVFTEPTAIDNCSETNISFVNFPGSRSTCGQEGVMRIWTATDECGNSSTIMQELIPIDTVGPVITNVGPGGNISCGESALFSDVSYKDNCNSSSIAFEDFETETSCQLKSFTRVWTATDFCGNITTASETFTQIDTTGPEFEIFQDVLTFYCEDSIIFTQLEAFDKCSEVTISFEDQLGSKNCVDYEQIRIWTATDLCGNISTTKQTAIFYDTIAPVIEEYQDTLYQDCSLTPEFPDLFAWDSCSEIDVTFSDLDGNTSCIGINIVRTWFVTDSCGNYSSATQTLIRIDTIAPIISGIGDDGFYDCSDGPEFDDPLVSDDCGSIIIEFTDEVSPGNCAGTGIRRTWTATDECGNSSSISQTLDPLDSTQPIITGVQDEIRLQCGSNELYCEEINSQMLFDLNSCRSFAEDNSHADYSEFVGEADNAIGGVTISNGNIYRINPSENTHSCTPGLNASEAMCIDSDSLCLYDANSEKNLIIEMAISPPSGGKGILRSISFFENAPANYIFNFGPSGVNNYPSLYGIQVLLNGIEIYNEVDIPTEQNWNFEEYNFEGQNLEFDSSGLLTIKLLPYCPVANGGDISVWDVEEVEIVFSNPLRTDCVDATDDCGDVDLIFVDNLISTNCAGEEYLRIYFATDDCGNRTTATQSIIKEDTEAPAIFGVYSTGEYECDQSPEFSTAYAIDNCSAVNLSFSDEYGEQTVSRTWRAEDHCGNVSTAVQTLEEVNCIIDLELDKSSNKLEAQIGEQILFTIELFNNSDHPAHDVIVEDLIQSGFLYINHSTNEGTYNTLNGLWYIGDLGAQETATLTITVWVRPTGEYYNEAILVQAREKDIDSEPNNGIDTDYDGDISDDPDDEDDADGVIISVLNNFVLNVYPQPASNQLNIEFSISKSSTISWQIYTIDGLQLKHSEPELIQRGSTIYEIDLYDLPSGSYLLKAELNQIKVLKKIIVIK